MKIIIENNPPTIDERSSLQVLKLLDDIAALVRSIR